MEIFDGKTNDGIKIEVPGETPIPERQVPNVPQAALNTETPGAPEQDWSQLTAAEAHKAGATRMVLCKDGYYVPSEFTADR